MARYSLFVLKVPLNTKLTNNVIDVVIICFSADRVFNPSGEVPAKKFVNH